MTQLISPLAIPLLGRHKPVAPSWPEAGEGENLIVLPASFQIMQATITTGGKQTYDIINKQNAEEQDITAYASDFASVMLGGNIGVFSLLSNVPLVGQGFAAQISLLWKEMRSIKKQVKKLARREGAAYHPVEMSILHFEPEPFEVTGGIRALVRQDKDSFVATFVDANIGASGETQNDAVANLKDMMVALFGRLSKEEGRLGKEPARQLAVLRAVLRRKN